MSFFELGVFRVLSLDSVICLSFQSNKVNQSIRNCLDENDPMGLEYRGTRNVSSRQVPCQSWDDLGEWNKFHPSHYPNADLTGNYCRNPDQDKMGPWCFISIRPERKFQYCKIRTCKSHSRLTLTKYSL